MKVTAHSTQMYMMKHSEIRKQLYEPVHMPENQQFVFRPGPTQTGLYSYRRWLEAGNFGFRK